MQRSLDSSVPPETLDRAAAEAEVEALRAEIRRHDYLYHVEARPEISDAAYDRIYRRLQAIEARFPDLVTPDSPTQRVGAEPRDDLPTIPHLAPMLSLDSTQKEEDLRRFHDRTVKSVEGAVQYLLEPKLDGLSIELVYLEGVLDRAVTRGNGREGEGVTENIRTIRSVPLRLRAEERPSPPLLSIRGEVLMSLSAFESLNQELVEKGEEPFANPRNAAAGAIRQLDSAITASRPLHFLAFNVLVVEGMGFRSDEEVLHALRSWGLRTPERVRLVSEVDEILRYHEEFALERDSLDYEIDGIVIKVNDLDARTDLGSTSRHPRWALAYKFEPRKEVTRIERIAVQVGRTGVLTPVALLRPVEVGGVTVSRASLHNREELVRKDVREGDLVRVQRAGDVIPQVVERIEEPERERPEPYRMPERCPNCDSLLVVRGPFTVCPNRFECTAQLKGRIVHFGSRHALDIEGLGEETARLLVGRGLVSELAHLFDLTAAELEALPGFANKSAENLAAAISRRKNVPLERFLFGLGIPEVGVAVSHDLARHFRGLEAVRAATREELEEVPGIGPKMSEQIVAFFQDERVAAAIDAVLERGVRPKPPEAAREGPLDGRKFVFTGGLESLTRAEAKRLVEGAAGTVTSSVSGETDVVVAGEDAGSKLERARDLGVEILDEEGFLRLLDSHGIRS